jgi:hypothetical protein
MRLIVRVIGKVLRLVGVPRPKYAFAKPISMVLPWSPEASILAEMAQ